MFFPYCKSMGANDPWGRTIFDPRCMVGRIYKEDRYIQRMKALGLVVSEKKIFLCFPAGPVWTPGAQLAGFIKKITIHCYTQNMKAVVLVVSEKKCFFHCKSMGANDPRAGHFYSRGMVGRIYKEDHYSLLHTK